MESSVSISLSLVVGQALLFVDRRVDSSSIRAVSAAEMTANEIQFARRDEERRDDIPEDGPEEGG